MTSVAGVTVNAGEICVGADIGGTFTDIALDVAGEIYSAKVLTDRNAPEKAVLEGIANVNRQVGIALADIDVIIHGTTLATNALIERRGARCAFLTTEGFRDVIEMRSENRYDQYDLNIQLNPPLIPRQHRFPVKGRIDANGNELQPLDEEAIEKLALEFASSEFESVAVGFIHSYLNSSHEKRACEILKSALPNVPMSLSCEVSPQFREYFRFSTVCANAYVRSRIENYLTRLQELLESGGASCSIYMIHSAGGLISVETAKQFPVRLVESGPAGGAIFAAEMSARFGLGQVVSFDMGGTTAKICLIENAQPRTSRSFEVARSHRFCKGSGIPISIPVIEMIEIGAGGGSISWIDSMGRIQIGPHSAGSDPGPVCYQRGGQHATVTDADLALGKIDPDSFAGGAIQVSKSASCATIDQEIGERLSLSTSDAAFGICEVVDENMSNAARVHAVENGKNISDYTMIAFGGAAPLHASRICQKLGIDRCLIPRGAGVGSAIGFLKTPFSYEAVASRVMSLSHFDFKIANEMLSNLIKSAKGFVRAGTGAPISLEITAFMRYQGQGWEIPVPLSSELMEMHDVKEITKRFEECYRNFFGRTIDTLDDLEIEIVSWSVKASEEQNHPEHKSLNSKLSNSRQFESRAVFDSAAGEMTESTIVNRDELTVGDTIRGPAIIVERETSTVVTSCYDAILQEDGSILLNSRRVE